MSSRCLASLLLGLSLLAGCDREERSPSGQPMPESEPMVETTTLFPGNSAPAAPDPRAKIYEGSAQHIAEGQRLYKWMNCSGCHANGGGAIGPPLMDDIWIYGGRTDQIAQTILQGRPNGMPSFHAKMTDEQVWQVAAYVKSLAGETPKDAVPSRADAMSTAEPLTLKESDATAVGSALAR